jgi:hypothetical protein
MRRETHGGTTDEEGDSHGGTEATEKEGDSHGGTEATEKEDLRAIDW